MVQVEIESVRMSLMAQARLVVLKDIARERFLPIWIGPFEADAITLELQGVQVSRPLTHDLFTSVLHLVNAKVERVEITDLVDGVFYSQLHLEGAITVSARPSDAIALALRVGAPISAADSLFAKAGIEIPDQSEDEVEKFREFLDQINPEDFAS